MNSFNHFLNFHYRRCAREYQIEVLCHPHNERTALTFFSNVYYRRCAREARDKGMTTFSIQNYGDCYSGEQAAATYYQEGEQRYFSDPSQPKPWLGCLDTNKQECHSNNLECGGQERTNYVYTLESGK